MRRFANYVRTLHSIIDEILSNPDAAWSEEVDANLDGKPGRELRRLVPLDARRRSGAFFTGSGLAKRAVQRYRGTIAKGVTCDPACGAGDLLVAAAEYLPVSDDLSKTLAAWANQLRGFDIHEEFVEVTKLRLVLSALRRGARARRMSAAGLIRRLQGIETRDGVAQPITDANVVLVNPPYGSRVAPLDCAWATGSVSDAAVFIQRLVDGLPDDTRMVAILPDVLRTGSRYARWREYIDARIKRAGADVIGVFDQWADVDVFLLHGQRIEPNEPNVDSRWWVESGAAARVSDRFDVHVGAVVPHRDPHTGPWFKYIDARILSRQESFDIAAAGSRRFNRRTFSPPFVVIRRTSRPDEKRRAVGTLIVGADTVAVENHLLVVVPRTGSIDACTELLKVLAADSTNAWLNERIRCRHLTVGAVADIPWPDVTDRES